MKKTARQRYEAIPPIKEGELNVKWHERMSLYTQMLGEESEGMTAYQWCKYLDLPYDEKEAYSKKCRSGQNEKIK